MSVTGRKCSSQMPSQRKHELSSMSSNSHLRSPSYPWPCFSAAMVLVQAMPMSLEGVNWLCSDFYGASAPAAAHTCLRAVRRSQGYF